MRIIHYIPLRKKYAVYSNEKAFTLIEVLYALAIFSIIIFFIQPVLQMILDHRDSNASLQNMEWQVFCAQLKKEIRFASHVEVVSGKLFLKNDNDETVIYEKYGSNLRRRVNFTGHEIVLQNVDQYIFSLQRNAVKVTVKHLNGKVQSFIGYSLINRDISA
ncbi:MULTISPECIES: competence type IV pilus minor pilin ComGF [Neobacillus]|uniref:competence type IV pilus minor pilin ComGF n=1 Tax=Neobacillus TaxID=2675232 RepID=UPI00068EFC83|nr:competence type IV pilus minor pilin ComGF [Neobacillus sedimentimangrovi]